MSPKQCELCEVFSLNTEPYTLKIKAWELILFFRIGYALQKGQAQALAHSLLFYFLLCIKRNRVEAQMIICFYQTLI